MEEFNGRKAKKAGSFTTTYKTRFYTNQMDYLRETQKVYNEIIRKILRVDF